MSVSDVVNQIHGCSQFFDTQSRLLAREDVKKNQQAMRVSLRAQIQSLPSLDAVSAIALSKAIDDSKFNDDDETLLATAVQNKVIAPSTHVVAVSTNQEGVTEKGSLPKLVVSRSIRRCKFGYQLLHMHSVHL